MSTKICQKTKVYLQAKKYRLKCVCSFRYIVLWLNVILGKLGHKFCSLCQSDILRYIIFVHYMKSSHRETEINMNVFKS